VAKYQAIQVDAKLADTEMTCAGIDGNPFYDMTWLASEREIHSDGTFSRPSNLPVPRLRIVEQAAGHLRWNIDYPPSQPDQGQNSI